MTTALLERPLPRTTFAPTVTFSVTVVDGSGREVYDEPVSVRFFLSDGMAHTVTRLTGADGSAHFTGRLAGPRPVIVTAHGESLGPLRPHDGCRLVIET